MSHKLSTLFLLIACFLGVNVSLLGQTATAVHEIPGYVDARTKIFYSTPHPQVSDAEPPATTTFAGKFVFNFTITVDSTITSTGLIGCNAGASLTDTGTENNIVELGGTSVTRGTGSTVKCSVTVPYSWKLASSSTDTIGLSYSLTSPAGLPLLQEQSQYPNRLGAQRIATIKVPANGATTTETIAATM